MVQYAESMEKLDNNAVFWAMCPPQEQEQQEQQQTKQKLDPRCYVQGVPSHLGQ
jgi:hypothetical protein